MRKFIAIRSIECRDSPRCREPSRYLCRLSYLYNTNRPLWPFLMIGNVDDLRWTTLFVTLKIGFSLTCTQTRLLQPTGNWRRRCEQRCI